MGDGAASLLDFNLYRFFLSRAPSPPQAGKRSESLLSLVRGARASVSLPPFLRSVLFSFSAPPSSQPCSFSFWPYVHGLPRIRVRGYQRQCPYHGSRGSRSTDSLLKGDKHAAACAGPRPKWIGPLLYADTRPAYVSQAASEGRGTAEV